VCAQMSHEPVYGPLVRHELAEGTTVCTRPVTTS
jgi:hypothetical protein